MYRQKIQSMRLRIVSIGILSIMVTVCFTSACQPTPEEDIVIPRDNAEKIIFDSKNNAVNPYVYNAPSKAEERFSLFKDSCDVVVDAPVDMPPIKEFPVAKCQTVKFDKQTADRFIDYFAAGGELVTPRVLTKQDYDEMITEEKRGRIEDGEYVVDELTQESVAELEERRAQAPDEDTPTPITDYTMTGTGLNARIIRNNETVGTIHANESLIGFMSPAPYRPFTVYTNNSDTGLDERSDADYSIGMTADEAQGIAENVLSAFGISGFEVNRTMDIYYYGEDLSDIQFGGYHIVFVRGFGGMMPLYITSFSGNPQDRYEYCPPVKTESIQMDIDEYGKVQGFSWQHPIEIVETITTNVELLPFEDIMQRMREYAKQHWAWQYNESEIASKTESVSSDITAQNNNIDVIKIYDIALNLSYIPMKNNADEFMYAPCWVFAYEFTESAATDQEEIDKGLYADQYIILNAVDGGSISVCPADLAREIEQGDISGEIQLPISPDWHF